MEITNEVSEEWLDIGEYEGIYKISNKGNVFSVISNRNLKPSPSKKGRMFVSLAKEGISFRVSIHRLVAKAFVSNPDNKPQINHLDGNPKNNNASNLEWCTAKENVQHAWRTGLCKPRTISAYERKLISDRNSRKVFIKNIFTGQVDCFSSVQFLAASAHLSQSAISNAIKRNTKILRTYWVSFYNEFNINQNSEKYRVPLKCTMPSGEFKNFASACAAGKELSLDKSFIKKVADGKFKQYKGYKFSYLTSVEQQISAGIIKLIE